MGADQLVAQLIGCRLAPGMELPSSADYGRCMSLITQLPDSDLPGAFGLPENIEGSVQRTQRSVSSPALSGSHLGRSSNVVAQLRKLAVSSALTARFDRAAWKQQLSPLLSLWIKLTQGQHMLTKAPRLATPESGQTPTDSFVVAECDMVHKLVRQKRQECL